MISPCSANYIRGFGRPCIRLYLRGRDVRVNGEEGASLRVLDASYTSHLAQLASFSDFHIFRMGVHNVCYNLGSSRGIITVS